MLDSALNLQREADQRGRERNMDYDWIKVKLRDD